jgi:N6-adenosine-specific RNA methylase IME4
MNDQQIRSGNTRNLLKKLTVAIIVIAAYQLTFNDPVKPSVELFEINLIEETHLAKLELVSGDERDGRTEITMQLSLNIDLGKKLNKLINAIITSR